jgi:putative ABC transport system permease protein
VRVFRLLGGRRIRQQPLKAAIATVAVAAAVSLVIAIMVTSVSIQRSVADFGRSLAGPAPLRIVGPTTRAGLTTEAVGAAGAVDGVDAIVPMVQTVALADDAGSTEPTSVLALGVDCRIEALLGDVGCDPAMLAAAAGAGDLPVAVGPALGSQPDASLRTDTGRVSLAGLPVLDRLAALNDGRVVVFELGSAQRRFIQPDRFDVAYVLPAPGADLGVIRSQLRDVVGPQNAVLSSTDPPAETEVVLLTFLPLFSLLGLFGLATGAVLVNNTVSLSLEERRRQLAILGALGASRRTVLGGAVAEAALLGMVGGLLGIAGGVLVSRPIVASLSNFTESVAGVALENHMPGSSYVIGILLGALVGGAAALLSARRALRADVAAELSGRAGVAEAKPLRLVRRAAIWSALGGLGALGCWVSQRDGGLEPWQATLGPLAFLLLAIALPLSGAAFAPLLVGQLARRARRTGRASLLLAVADLVRDPRRTGIMAVAVTSPIIIGFATDGFVASARSSIERDIGGSSDGVSLSTIDVNTGYDGFLTDDVLAAIAAVPGVGELHRGTFLSVGTDASDIVGVQAYEGTDLTGFDVLRGDADVERLRAGEVLIGPGLARRTGLREGDTLELRTPTGLVDLPVQGVLTGGGFGGQNVVMDFDQLNQLYGRRPAGFVVAEPADGVPEAELATRLRAAAPSIDPELRVLSTDELVDEIVTSIETQMAPFRVMHAALQGVALVAVLSTLLLAGYQRRREHGMLAAIGARPPDLGRVVVSQAGIVGMTAVVCGAVFGPLLLWAFLQVIPLLIGERNQFEADWLSLATSSVVGIVVAVVGAAWPAWRAARIEVLDALRYE